MLYRFNRSSTALFNIEKNELIQGTREIVKKTRKKEIIFMNIVIYEC